MGRAGGRAGGVAQGAASPAVPSPVRSPSSGRGPPAVRVGSSGAFAVLPSAAACATDCRPDPPPCRESEISRLAKALAVEWVEVEPAAGAPAREWPALRAELTAELQRRESALPPEPAKPEGY